MNNQQYKTKVYQRGSVYCILIWSLSFFVSCFRNELHAIVDEVYMLTVFDESVTFHSVLSVDRYARNLTSAWLLY